MIVETLYVVWAQRLARLNTDLRRWHRYDHRWARIGL